MKSSAKQKWVRLFLSVAVFSAIALSISWAAFKLGGGTGPFPSQLLEGLSSSARPSVEVNETLTLDVRGLREFSVEATSAALDVTFNEDERVPSGTAALELTGSMPGPGEDVVADVRRTKRYVSAARNGARFDVKIHEFTEGGWFRFDFSDAPKRLSLRVRLPNDFTGALQLKTVAGDVRVRRMELESLNLTSISGDLNFSDGSARTLAIATTSGTVDVEARVVDVDVELTSGSANLVLLPNSATSGRLRVTSVSGDVRLSLADVKGEVALKSVSGQVKSEFAGLIDDSGPGRRELKGVLGEGAGSMIVTSVSGDVDLKRLAR